MLVTDVKLSYHVDKDQSVSLAKQIVIEIGELLKI